MMAAEARVSITTVRPGAAAGLVPALGALLHACVRDGASVGFLLPFAQAEGEAFWRTRVLPALDAGTRVLLVATRDGTVVGTVQLDHDTMPNQPHRAEVSKLLVHPGHRRRGIARRLMAAVERAAVEGGRTLITLDTRTGDAAEPLYQSLGYQTVGPIPGYCLNPFDGRPESTTILYKALRPGPSPSV